MGYKKNKDYCTYSPDTLFEVDFSYACYLHDRQYRNEVKNRKTRKQADAELKKVIIKKFTSKNKKYIGSIIGNLYYFAVRLFSKFAWDDDKNKTKRR